MRSGLGRAARFAAPAKLNLFLHVTSRRADGYHNLQTAFQFLDFGDELEFEGRSDGRIEIHGSLPGLRPEQDLIGRAALALGREMGRVPGVTVRVLKRIPAGGGLGGGSSDAATTLLVLNRLWGLHLALDRLAELGLALGADVPVFVRGHSAFAEGVGERLVPVDPPEPWYLVITPPQAVDTAAVFADPQLTRNCPPVTISDFVGGRVALRNVCLPVVRQRYPLVGDAHDWLAEFAQPRLSGTGSSVFACFADRAAAAEVARQVPHGWARFVARGLNQSPLHQQLESFGV